MKQEYLNCVLGIALGAFASASLAQSRGAVGNPVDALPQVKAPPQQPTVSVQVQPQTLQLQLLLSRHLTPTKIQIAGVKSVPFDQVSKHFSSLVGKDVTIADLIVAANEVTALYQQRGFAISSAFIPDQTFEGGVVRVTIVEGYVAQVNVTGKTGRSEGRVRAIANHIMADRPLRRKTFDHYIQALGLLPGIKINANVPAPTNTSGATSLDLTVDRTPFNVTAGLDMNHPGFQALITASENGLTPLGEQLSFSALEPKGRDSQTYYAASGAIPIGSEGMITRIDASHYRGEPVDNPGLPNYVHRRVTQEKLGLSLAYPLYLSSTTSLFGTVSGYASHNEDQYNNILNGLQLGLRSQTRVIQTQFDYTNVITDRVRKASFVIAKGLNVLGASKSGDTNVPGATLDNPISLTFLRTGASFSQSNQWPFHLGTVISVTGQYSPNSLPTSEQITFGGQRFALGYEPGETSGDSGWGVSVELNRSFTLSYAYLKSITPYVAFDTARVYLHSGPTSPNRLASAGVGFRISDAKHYSLDLSLAKPIGDTPAETTSRAPRVNANFSYQFN